MYRTLGCPLDPMDHFPSGELLQSPTGG
ncbi:unnamed protein product [Ectocarpus sp. CCAP 1310/34]|nr:unnamed protein product [Ectocarpus sp. CCAP 1310/34]